MNKIKINKLQQILDIQFKSQDLLIKALTHKSFDPDNNNEKLEFLGDRVLGLIISMKLIELYPNQKVGMLDKKFASLVNKNICLEVGKKLSLEQFILIGNSNKKTYTIENKIISDCCESIIGAIYLEKGYNLTKKIVLNYWKDYIKLSNINIVDSKTKLQELSLKYFKKLPIYKLVSHSGPHHKPSFKIGVKLKNTNYVYAHGSSKKDAEQLAAKKLLKLIDQS